MKTYINNESNTKVYVKGFRFGGVNGYFIYDYNTLSLITAVDRKTLNKEYTKVA